MLLDCQDSYLVTIIVELTNNSFVFLSIFKQSVLLLDAFNKDRASLPQPLPNPPPLAPLPAAAPDPQTQEMINEKMRKAEELGKSMILLLVMFSFANLYTHGFSAKNYICSILIVLKNLTTDKHNQPIQTH